jgi:hypothetical protein
MEINVIYILAPASAATGGPEALHQLANALNKNFNFKIKMVYLPKNVHNPVHDNYKNYSIEHTNIIDDDEKNILIAPEYYEYLEELNKYKKIKKIIWWLSLDNYLNSRFRKKNFKFLRSLLKIPLSIIKFFNKITFFYFGIFTDQDYIKFLYKYSNFKNFEEFKNINFHFAQSNYAHNFLKKKLLNVSYLSDYQRKIFYQNSSTEKTVKENLICYYPFKSNDFVKDIINHNQNLKFIPINNFSTTEIIKLLKKTKIYIDFGYHPGKDRIPREAVLMRNCIITNRKGSAYNDVDIPINNEFKFNELYLNLEKINAKILDIFENYESEFLKFQKYYNKILNEEDLFNKEVRDNFKNIF